MELTSRKRWGQRRKRLWKLLTAAAVLALTGIAVGILAMGASNVPKNTYALTIENKVTCAYPENVLYIAVSYVDKNGIQRDTFINTCQGALQESYMRALLWEGKSHEADSAAQKSKAVRSTWLYKRMNLVNSASGYTSLGYQGSEYPQFDFGMGFRQNTTDTYLFSTEWEVKNITSVEFFCTWSQDEAGVKHGGTIGLQSMRLYKVDQLNGLRMPGYYSDQLYLDFSGTLLYQARYGSNSNNITLSWETGARFQFDAGSSSGYNLQEINAAADTTATTFYMTMKFRDSYQAGIENLATAYQGAGTISHKEIPECLTMNLTYYDTRGSLRELNLPVITSYLAWACEEGVSKTQRFLGFAQQGETIGFPITLPDYDPNRGIASYKLTYKAYLSMGGEKGVRLTSGNTAACQARMDAINGTQTTMAVDDIILNYIALYDASQAGNSVTVVDAGNQILITERGAPSFYMKSKQGNSLAVSNSLSGTFSTTWQSTDTLENYDYSNTYLVAISTDAVGQAGTREAIKLRLHYTDTSGNSKNSSTYEVKQLVGDFYGYWPSSSNDTDFAFRYAAQTGATMYFLVTLKNVQEFTGCTVYVGNEANDDWQMSGIQIYDRLTIDARKGAWQSVYVEALKTYSDRIITRTFSGDLRVKVESTTLVQAGTYKTIVFNDVYVPEEVVDWSEHVAAMDYETATSDLALTVTRSTYQVKVIVSNESTTMDEGDCGSKNKFFFQLVFENGSSGYVLANQQLSADGFRDGRTETFLIKCNQQYGDLVSVRIIPDDISGDSDKYDKLKIDSIEVTLETNSCTSLTWMVENVGWVGIDYSDEGTQTSISGKTGRSAAELAREYTITSYTYSVNMIFAVTTDAASPQFQGSMAAVIEYENAEGETVQERIDVVEAIGSFVNHSPEYQTVSGQTRAVSNTDHMFRPGHTDRFLVALKGVVRVRSIQFILTSPVNVGSWEVSSVAISLIDTDAGSLYLNTEDDYNLSGTQTILTTSGNEEGYEVLYSQNTPTTMNVEFVGNEVSVDLKADSYATTISRTPVTRTDTLNLYLYADSTYGFRNGAQQAPVQGLTCVLKYTDIYGTAYQYSAPMQLDLAANKAWCVGMTTTNLSTVTKLLTIKNEYYKLDHAIIQQVRSGVVIKTYYVDFNGADGSYDQGKTPGGLKSKQSQTVQLQVSGAMTGVLALDPETKDVAVSVRYTSTLDDGTGNEGTVYRSAYTFITDALTAAASDAPITANISAGDILTLNFQEAYVKEIFGFSAATAGDYLLPVECALVQSWEGSGESAVLTGWYSVADPFTVTPVAATMALTADRQDEMGSVVPVTFTIRTGSAMASLDTGTNTAVRGSVTYRDFDDHTFVRAYDDLRPYITSVTRNGVAVEGQSFVTDSLATVELLMPNIADLRYITLEPYDGDEANTASWYVEQITAAWRWVRYEQSTTQSGGLRAMTPQYSERTRSVGAWAYETSPNTEPLKINISDVKLSISARSTDGNGVTTEGRTAGDEITITAFSESLLRLYITFDGSEEGVGLDTTVPDKYAAEYQKLSDDCTVTPVSDELIEVQLGLNDTGADQKYLVSVYSREMPTIRRYILITLRSRIAVHGTATYQSTSWTSEKGVIGTEEADGSITPVISIQNHETVTIKPSVVASTKGWTILKNGAEAFCKQNSNGTITFTAENDSYEEQIVTVMIAAVEDATATLNIPIRVGGKVGVEVQVAQGAGITVTTNSKGTSVVMDSGAILNITAVTHNAEQYTVAHTGGTLTDDRAGAMTFTHINNNVDFADYTITVSVTDPVLKKPVKYVVSVRINPRVFLTVRNAGAEVTEGQTINITRHDSLTFEVAFQNYQGDPEVLVTMEGSEYKPVILPENRTSSTPAKKIDVTYGDAGVVFTPTRSGTYHFTIRCAYATYATVSFTVVVAQVEDLSGIAYFNGATTEYCYNSGETHEFLTRTTYSFFFTCTGGPTNTADIYLDGAEYALGATSPLNLPFFEPGTHKIVIVCADDPALEFVINVNVKN